MLQSKFTKELNALVARHGYELDIERALSSGVLVPLSSLPTKIGDFTFEDVKLALQSRVLERYFSAWIAPLEMRSIDERRIVLVAESEFAAQWAQEQYLEIIVEVLRKDFQVSESVEVEIVA